MSGKILIGTIPCVKLTEKAIRANTVFTKTPHNKINTLAHREAEMKLSGALNSSLSSGFSPLSLTNPHRGIALIVYSVPCLSLPSDQTLGGIPIPNSITLTRKYLAIEK